MQERSQEALEIKSLKQDQNEKHYKAQTRLLSGHQKEIQYIHHNKKINLILEPLHHARTLFRSK